MDIDFKINNENHEVCSRCGGDCCKRMGCHYSPRDFNEITVQALEKEINKGFISIDWWEGDVFNNDRERTYYLRVRNKNKNIVDPAWRGECSLLTEYGCILPFKQRPMGGRALVPNKQGNGNNCKSKYTKEDCCKEWYPYQDILEKLVDKFGRGTN